MGGRGGKEPSLAPSIPEGTPFVGGQGRGLGWSTFPGRRPAAGQGSSQDIPILPIPGRGPRVPWRPGRGQRPRQRLLSSISEHRTQL